MLEPQALASALLPLRSKLSATALKAPAVPDTTDSNPVSRTPSGSSISSVASTTSGGDDTPSVFSSPTQTASTRLTTPANSDRGAQPPEEGIEAFTIASRKSTSSASTVRKRSREEARKLTYTDEDWAEDMPAASGSSSSTRRHSRVIPPDFQLPPPLELGGSTPRRPGSSRTKGDRRRRMSALWEEDESEECSTGVSSTEPSRASTPILDTPPQSLPPSPLAKATTLPPESQDDNPPSESTHESTPDARLQKYARGHRSTLSTTTSLFRPGGSSSAHLPTHPLPTPFPAPSSSTSNGGYTGLTLPHAGYSNAKGKTTAEGHVDLVRAGIAQSSMCTIEVIRGVAATISSGTSPIPLPHPKSRSRSFSISLGRSFSLSLRPKRRDTATPAHLQGSLPLPVAFTAHVSPPTYVPESHVLVQVHAVGLDTLDSLIVHEKSGMSGGGGHSGSKGIGGGKAGFIPGRSFVGKVVECGWAVSAEVCKRGEWVIGLLDVRKCGALAEFIVVERHRVHRVPQPRARSASLFPPRRRAHIRSASLPANGSALAYASSPLAPAPLTVEELALLPLCGVPAHRAVRTFTDVLAPPVNRSPNSTAKPDVRALVLQGHDGAGALAVQMLGRRGVRICVQVPESAMYDSHEEEHAGTGISTRVSPSKNKGKGKAGVVSRREQVEARLRAWGAEDICVGEPLDVLRRFAEEGQSFDAILDTVGGVQIWEASQRLLTMDWTDAAGRSSLSLASRSEVKLNGNGNGHSVGGYDSSTEHADAGAHRPSKLKGKVVSHAQFTTLVGDTPQRAVPTAQDNLRSGLRSLRRSMSTSGAPHKSSPAALGRSAGAAPKSKRVVGYAWVSVAADVDFEGEDVRDSLGAVVRMAEGGWLRPWVGGAPAGAGAGTGPDEGKVVPFERAPEVFRRGIVVPLGVLADGGTCAVKIVE
ncbi:hypothetical protein BD413DRAFT_623744 [Trametes elegans]|nr:hypothetical protein BD413DRAFT_623744 [Trametes elegans]